MMKIHFYLHTITIVYITIIISIAEAESCNQRSQPEKGARRENFLQFFIYFILFNIEYPWISTDNSILDISFH